MKRTTKSTSNTEGHSLRVLSYNIHQGKTASRRRLEFSLLKQAIKALHADIVLLQEVAGSTRAKKNAPADVECAYQLEALADGIWKYQAYQRNSVFSGGYHGNAILSKFPIVRWNVLNITIRGLARRGILHGEVDIPGMGNPFHVLATHLGLLQYERHKQVQRLCHYVSESIPGHTPLLIGGDFNDWREHVSEKLGSKLNVEEAFMAQHAEHARTFPARMPVLRLDRIYYRGLSLHSVLRLNGKPWHLLSDHLPILAQFKLPDPNLK
jgi:endonuclease/exonuclease/phosphatase family metal-dependent hydrolase